MSNMDHALGCYELYKLQVILRIPLKRTARSYHRSSNSANSSQTLFTWSGGPRSSGVGFFCFHAPGDTKQKKPTPKDRGPPLHVNRVLELVIKRCKLLFNILHLHTSCPLFFYHLSMHAGRLTRSNELFILFSELAGLFGSSQPSLFRT